MRSHELCASAASDKHTSDANGKGGWSGMGGRKMDLLLIFSFFRMNSRQNSSRSNAWKSTDSPFHAGRAPGASDAVVIRDRARGASLVPP